MAITAQAVQAFSSRTVSQTRKHAISVRCNPMGGPRGRSIRVLRGNTIVRFKRACADTDAPTARALSAFKRTAAVLIHWAIYFPSSTTGHHDILASQCWRRSNSSCDKREFELVAAVACAPPKIHYGRAIDRQSAC